MSDDSWLLAARGEPEILVLADPDACAALAAERIEIGRAHV